MQCVIAKAAFMKVSTKALASTVICIVLAASFLLLFESNLELLFATEVTFEEVDWNGGYGFGSRANFTIRNATYWESLWLDLYSGHSHIPEVPTVNFTSEMLIAVFQGERSSSGYLTNITRIIMTTTYYLVYVDEIHPGEDCITLTVMTYPYHIVKIGDYPLNLPVRFAYNITIYSCG